MAEDDGILDSRFETEASDVEHLLSVMDIDELEEFATLLMVLFMRPVVVEEVWDAESEAPCLEIILAGDEHSIGTTYEFPTSVLQLVGGCIETAAELGPYDSATHQAAAHELSGLDRHALVGVLQRALGHVRLLLMSDQD
jgi:hypothetical protein